MITEAAQKTGLFHVNYTIATANIGEPVFFLSMTVNTVDKVINGAGRITQSINPPVDVRTSLHGSYTTMTVMPDKSHILVVASGQGPIGSITPLTGINVELRMIMSSDWKSGVANYRYLNAQGAWIEVSNMPVNLDG